MGGWLAGCRDREPHWRYSLAGLDRGHHEVFAWGSIDKSTVTGRIADFRYTEIEGCRFLTNSKESCMRSIIYIIGLIVVVLFILSMLGLR